MTSHNIIPLVCTCVALRPQGRLLLLPGLGVRSTQAPPPVDASGPKLLLVTGARMPLGGQEEGCMGDDDSGAGRGQQSVRRACLLHCLREPKSGDATLLPPAVPRLWGIWRSSAPDSHSLGASSPAQDGAKRWAGELFWVWKEGCGGWEGGEVRIGRAGPLLLAPSTHRSHPACGQSSIWPQHKCSRARGGGRRWRREVKAGDGIGRGEVSPGPGSPQMVNWMQRNSPGDMDLWAVMEKKPASFFRPYVVVVMGLRGACHKGHLGALEISVTWDLPVCRSGPTSDNRKVGPGAVGPRGGRQRATRGSSRRPCWPHLD